jgi:hypothetical protein
VSLVLPDEATSIKAGDSDAPTFKKFSALTTASGAGIETIGAYTFSICTTLETASFPEASSIGGGAFSGCTALETADFPKATSIGDYAFSGCTALETVNIPEATSIGGSAFYNCTVLETANLPEVTIIGESAFAGCTSRKTVNIPKATTIRGDVLMYTGGQSLTVTLGSTPTLGMDKFDWVDVSKSVTVRVPAGATGYGTVPATYSGSNSTISWGNGFRGKGWSGYGFYGSIHNAEITLTITNR